MENGGGSRGLSGNALGTAPGANASGACSKITWALVPDTPNADTPARLARPAAGHARASSSSRTAPEAQSTCGEGVPACKVLGSTPCRIAMTVLMIPATPAAACGCPMFDFSDPSHNGRSASRPWP